MFNSLKKFQKIYHFAKKIKDFFTWLNMNAFPNHYYKNRIAGFERDFNGAASPALYIKDKYYKQFSYDLNLDNPKAFYEKINYLKLYYKEVCAERLVDKVEVKKYLSELGFNEHLTKMICFFNDFCDFKSYIRNSDCDKEIVVKLNHVSGIVFFYKKRKWRNKYGQKVSKRVVFAALRHMLHFNYSHVDFQMVYDRIKPKIFIEEYLPSLNSQGLDEFKFFCSYGNAKLINVVFGRQKGSKMREAFTDENLLLLPVNQGHESLRQEEIYKPECFEEMVAFCKKTVSDRPLIRVDFMTDGHRFYFCEFTFYDCGGFNIFYPLNYNFTIGNRFDFSNLSVTSAEIL